MIEWIHHFENRFLEKNLDTIFEGISNSRKKALNNWFQDQWLKINALTRSLISASEENELSDSKSATLSKVKEILDDSIIHYDEFIEAFLMDEQGYVILSSFPKHVGLTYTNTPILAKAAQDEPYMYGPFCDPNTLTIPLSDKPFSDEVTLLFSNPCTINDEKRILCIRILNDDMSNVIQEEKSHVFKDSGDNYIFIIENKRNIPAGTAISRSRFEDNTFTLGGNLKDGVRTKHGNTVQIKKHTEFEIRFTDPATNELHEGIKQTIANKENLNCWPGYPDYRHVQVGGKGCVIQPPYSDELWGMMCEADIAEMYHFHSLNLRLPLLNLVSFLAVFALHNVASRYCSTFLIPLDILLLFVLFLFGIFLARHCVTLPLNKTVTMLRAVAEGEGDLSHHVHLHTPNEMGELARWFNKFIYTQRRMLLRVKDAVKVSKHTLKRVSSASDKITSGIADINETMQTLSINSKKQNHLFQKTQEEIQRISDTFENNDNLADLVKEIEDKTQATHSTSSNAKSLTDEVVHSLNELETAMGTALQSIARLSTQSEQITNIVSTISNISSQTNLLALNASIEAANAGAAGKGFAVVATQVKALSQETQKATQTISALISSIQQEILLTSQNISIINKKVNASVSSTKESTKAVELVVDVSKTITQIMKMMEMQSQVIADVRHNIADMAEASQNAVEVGNTSTELANVKIHSISKQTVKLQKVVESLEISSQDLEDMVNAFKLKS